MKVLVTGDRNYSDREKVKEILTTLVQLNSSMGDHNEIILLHGAAKGADTLAGEVGASLDFRVVAIPADWERYGRAAGPIRNRQMLDEQPDLVIAFHDDIENSKGTKDCLMEAERRGIDSILVEEGITSEINLEIS